MRVLVTGFAPFGSYARNPSTDVAQAMHGAEHEGAYFVAFAPLPVLYEEAAKAALTAAKAIGADAIVSLGLAATTPHVRIERRARNHASADAGDNAGRVRLGKAADDAGAEALDTALDVDAIARAVREAGVDCATSDDAGGYVCNDLYYRLLATAQRDGSPRDVLFVHVPAHAAELTALPNALVRAVSDALRAAR